MKKSMVKLFAVVGVVIISGTYTFASTTGDDTTKTSNKSNSAVAVNGSYKHQYPTSPGNRFKDSFTKAEKEKVNRNYKQQNQEKRDVKFKDHFTAIPKTNRSSYKHPQGL